MGDVEAMSDMTNNLLRLTSALNACSLWHERRTELRINSYYYFYSHPYGWWCDDADNMLCKCCAEALFSSSRLQNFSNAIGFDWGFSPVIPHTCGHHAMWATWRQRERESESKVRKAVTRQHYDLPFKYWVRTIKLHPACITLSFNDNEYEPHWTRTFDSIWMKIDILFTRTHAFKCIPSGDTLTSKAECVSKHRIHWSVESFLWKTIKA